MKSEVYREITKDKRYDKDKVIKLLEDYANPTYGWFLSGHWNRHHMDEVKAALTHIKGKEYNNPQAVLSAFVEYFSNKNIKIDPQGSLGRRLEFIANEFHLHKDDSIFQNAK